MLNSIFIVMVTQQPKPLICFPRLYYDEARIHETQDKNMILTLPLSLVIDTVTINKTQMRTLKIYLNS